MKLHILKPKKALNKAFLKIKPIRSEIEVFKKNLKELIDNSNDVESEEFHKNLVADFLKRTYYDPNYFINTKGRNDLVIHNGDKANTPVGVILETKKPTNSSEMMSADRTNTKALQELVLYYLRERITEKNLEIKYLVVTNIYEWFIFDAKDFEKHFAQNKALVKQFIDFENKRLSGTSTDFFYKEIAAPAIEAIQGEVECTYFDFRKFDKVLRNSDLKDDIKLVSLFKLLSPEHLLKKPFANDSNTLDGKFYKELLHIIGLSEQKQGGKKVIERNPVAERNTGALLEDAIIQIESMDRLSRMDKPSQYGETKEERLFNVGLELAITWINRVLFLKLLEAQLIAYHSGDKKYAFLNYQRINSYDDLNSLFFQVLAKKHDERNADVLKAFENVPYLNSSLFEPTEIEHEALFISNLRDEKTLPILEGTVLKDANGKRRKGKITTLQYLFDFLNSYDFSGEGAENIQEDNKTLINASVLGLIFEKINGYKDGSFFTPGFITMYMCRETIRKAVVQKFNEAALNNAKSSTQSKSAQSKVESSPPLEGVRGEESISENENKYQSITDIYNAIGARGDFSHQEANELINDIKICDPAVGSGHFLVSALNEMIAVKHDLGVLHDRNGKLLRDYDVLIENDELIITDYNGELFEYHPQSLESQRVQETLFHEKQTIIENCLFGVDINPNSVKICRLRLWIELLKNAYYKNATELETLPNIDINIKCGNSLISRFDLNADLGKALRSSKWSMESYRIAVQTYRNAENKEQKREMERLIADIKGDFKTEISQNSKEQRLYDKISAELYEKHMAPKLFEETLSKSAKANIKKEREKLEIKVAKLKEQLDEIKNNKIYENAFEWRFEFPEVLDDDGKFVGFDVVIGNPPYISVKEIPKNEKDFYSKVYSVAKGQFDLYLIFTQLGYNILNNEGYFAFITSNTFISNRDCFDFRRFIANKTTIIEIINLDETVFTDAKLDVGILRFKKSIPKPHHSFWIIRDKESFINKNRDNYLNKRIIESESADIKINFTEHDWEIMDKLNNNEKLKDFVKITRGIEFGGNHESIVPEKKEGLLPLIVGSSISKYSIKNYKGFAPFIKDDLSKYKTFDLYSVPRILIQRIRNLSMKQRIVASYTDELILSTNTLRILIPIIDIDLKSLLAKLNSKLINYFFLLNFNNKDIYGYQLESIPVAQNEIMDIKLSTLVDQILTAKQEDPSADTTALENEIDVLVYRLYGLTYEEVKVVDEGFWMSEEEYNREENESGE